jgi:hypothetical protein
MLIPVMELVSSSWPVGLVYSLVTSFFRCRGVDAETPSSTFLNMAWDVYWGPDNMVQQILDIYATATKGMK